MEIEYFQTEGAMHTIALIRDGDCISLGIARAGKRDLKEGRVDPESGINIAFGRASKARTFKEPLIVKNYLRGIHAKKVEIS